MKMSERVMKCENCGHPLGAYFNRFIHLKKMVYGPDKYDFDKSYCAQMSATSGKRDYCGCKNPQPKGGE